MIPQQAESIVATNIFVTIDALQARIHDVTGKERQLAARVLGEMVAANSPTAGIKTLLENLLETAGNGVEESLQIRLLINSGSVNAQQIIDALAEADNSDTASDVDLSPYIALDEPAREHFFLALRAVFGTAEKSNSYPAIKKPLQNFVLKNNDADSIDISVPSRLAAIDILANLDGTVTEYSAG